MKTKIKVRVQDVAIESKKNKNNDKKYFMVEVEFVIHQKR